MEIQDIPETERTQPVNLQCSCGRIVTCMVRPQDLVARENGALVQDAFPYLTASEREMFISRLCGTCWDEIFGGEDDECPYPDIIEEWDEELTD